jgi:hypothetical protein
MRSFSSFGTQVRTERRIIRPELDRSALAEIERRGYPLRIVLMEAEVPGRLP